MLEVTIYFMKNIALKIRSGIVKSAIRSYKKVRALLVTDDIDVAIVLKVYKAKI